MKFKKMISTILCATVFFNSNYCSAEPTSWLAVCTIAGVVQTCVRFVLDGGGKIRQVVRHNNVIEALNQEVRQYGGFRTLQEIQRMICDIIEGRSRIKVYGQTRAKQQCFDALSGCMARMMRPADLGIEKQGNIVYIIGMSGTGKTTMAKAIASAFLKNWDRSCYMVVCSQINRSQPLGNQIFKTAGQIANIKPDTTKLGVMDTIFGKLDESITIPYDTQVISPMLEHFFKWNGKVVIIIDEYDKMKQMCKKPYDEEGDKSGDEILKSISSNGYYTVGTEKVDCSQALFIITSNETREQLEHNFGESGIVGGGAQRLNIIEFERIDEDCSKNIIINMIDEIKRELTNPSGQYGIKDVHFSDESIRQMALYISQNEVKQARAKDDLFGKIYRLFISELEQCKGKSFEVIYTPNGENNGDVGTFSKRVLQQPDNQDKCKFISQQCADFSDDLGEMADFSLGSYQDYA